MSPSPVPSGAVEAAVPGAPEKEISAKFVDSSLGAASFSQHSSLGLSLSWTDSSASSLLPTGTVIICITPFSTIGSGGLSFQL